VNGGGLKCDIGTIYVVTFHCNESLFVIVPRYHHNILICFSRISFPYRKAVCKLVPSFSSVRVTVSRSTGNIRTSTHPRCHFPFFQLVWTVLSVYHHLSVCLWTPVMSPSKRGVLSPCVWGETRPHLTWVFVCRVLDFLPTGLLSRHSQDSCFTTKSVVKTCSKKGSDFFLSETWPQFLWEWLIDLIYCPGTSLPLLYYYTHAD
jgi:hypothetical protein